MSTSPRSGRETSAALPTLRDNCDEPPMFSVPDNLLGDEPDASGEGRPDALTTERHDEVEADHRGFVDGYLWEAALGAGERRKKRVVTPRRQPARRGQIDRPG